MSRLKKDLKTLHPQLQALDEIRKQLIYLRDLVRLTWSREEFMTVVIGAFALLLGAVTVAFVVRQLREGPPRKASTKANAALPGESADALDSYLDLVDREMGDAAGEQR